MNDTKIVTFKKEWRGYAVGEIAGFDADTALALVDAGRAKMYVEKGPAAAPIPPQPGAKVTKKRDRTQSTKPPIADDVTTIVTPGSPAVVVGAEPDQPTQTEEGDDPELPALDDGPEEPELDEELDDEKP
ncbi:hypothetical protein [Pseudomonas mediterranea]|uniref:hypothetical protein n=1 Tax=Pseudomonas mediterranea TaxID=183795 RepID=UPI001D76FAE5|nr:hypothetical protein [Pseudomonas mediterranea]CAH0153548.1 hypothetical protein SRABI112_00750 [Pseudomonas mediterranea]